jgi:nitrogen fixation NifU-like protein
MENEFRELYQEIILDHNRSPRNFGKMEGSTHVLDGRNPLCGDHYTIYLKIENDIIQDVKFEGSGCAISKASASVMSTMVKGKSIEEADRYFKAFHEIVTGEGDLDSFLSEYGKLAAFAGVSEFPVRVKCATLAWHTMYNALHGKENAVSTE